MLEEIKEPLWAYLRQQCPFFLAGDYNACFSQIVEQKTFGKLTPDEMTVSFTYQKDAILKSSILVNFLTRYALQKCELNYNSWPQFVSSIQTQPGKLNRPDCETPTRVSQF